MSTFGYHRSASEEEKQRKEIIKQRVCGRLAVELANDARSDAIDAIHAGITSGITGASLRKLRYLGRKAEKAALKARAAYTAAWAAY